MAYAGNIAICNMKYAICNLYHPSTSGPCPSNAPVHACAPQLFPAVGGIFVGMPQLVQVMGAQQLADGGGDKGNSAQPPAEKRHRQRQERPEREAIVALARAWMAGLVGQQCDARGDAYGAH